MPTYIINGDFELPNVDWNNGFADSPDFGTGGYRLYAHASMRDGDTTNIYTTGGTKVSTLAKFGWRSSQDNGGGVSDVVEIQIDQKNGNKYAEICSEAYNTYLYQDIATEPGTVYKWSLKHTSIGAYEAIYGTKDLRWIDKMSVMIGSPGNETAQEATRLTSNGQSMSVITLNTPETGDTNQVGFTSTIIETPAKYGCNKGAYHSQGDWETYAGVYLVPEGQTTTRFTFKSVAQRTVNAGNHIDDVTFEIARDLTYDFNASDAKGTNYDPKSVKKSNDYAGYHVADETVQLTDVSAPTRAGYTFLGWTTTRLSDATTKSAIEDAKSKVVTSIKMPAKSTVVYAAWAKNPTVTFVDGVGNTLKTDKLNPGGSSSAPADPTRTNYKFTGWDKTSDAWTNVYEDVTITAQWASLYTIKFDANATTGVNGSTASMSMQYGVAKNLTKNGFTRDGYTWSTWNTKSDGSGTTYTKEQEVSDLTDEAGGVVTLYAQWTPNSYKIVFEPGDGGSGNMGTQSMKYDQSDNLTANTFTKVGWHWTGWKMRDYTKSYNQQEYYGDKELVKNLTTINNDTVYMVAQWEKNKYNVTFKENYQDTETTIEEYKVDYGSSIEEYTDKTVPHPGYTGTWDTDLPVTVTDDIVITINYTPNKYTVVFQPNGSDVKNDMSDQVMYYDKDYTLYPNAFVREGYTWTGWKMKDYTKSHNQQEDYADAESVSNLTTIANDTVYMAAQWTPVNYIVRYHANGGTGTMSDQTMTFDKSEKLTPYAFSRAGYTFQGWAVKEGTSTVSYEDNATVRNLANTAGAVVDLYAVWEENSPVEIRYVPENEHSTVSVPIETVNPATGSPTGSTATPSEGYHFVSWIDADGNVKGTDPTYMPKRGDDGLWHPETVYSHVESNSYTVSFDPNGGDGQMGDQAFVYDEKQALNVNEFSHVGYTFAGWNTEPDGSGNAYDDQQVVLNLTSEDGGKVVLYAQWAPNEYVVSFDANGGDGQMGDQPFVYDEEQDLDANQFSKTGYVWTGWNTSPDGAGDSYTDMQAVKNLVADDGGEITLYSQWRPAAYTIHFDGNGAPGSMPDQAMTYDVAANLLPNEFVRDGYAFNGWAIVKDGELVFVDSQEVLNLLSEDGGEITLYAVWTKVASENIVPTGDIALPPMFLIAIAVSAAAGAIVWTLARRSSSRKR